MRFFVFIVTFTIFLPLGHATPPSKHRLALPATSDYSNTLEYLLSTPEDQIDLTWSKLVIDQLVDINIDIEGDEAQISRLAIVAMDMAGPSSSDEQKVAALRRVIYESGWWNDGAAFSYDFDNPNGRLARNKTLNQYLTSKRGNCVNMPILFLVVGEKMGLRLNVTTAPRHMFVQFENRSTGQVIHLEPTSGALPQRISWQRKVLPMTDRAVESGMYMQRLSKRQQVVVMAETLLQALQETSDHDERLEVTTLMLEEFSQFDVALLHRQDALDKILKRDFVSKYPQSDLIPASLRSEFDRMASGHFEAWEHLNALGWQRARDTSEVIMPR